MGDKRACMIAATWNVFRTIFEQQTSEPCSESLCAHNRVCHQPAVEEWPWWRRRERGSRTPAPEVEYLHQADNYACWRTSASASCTSASSGVAPWCSEGPTVGGGYRGAALAHATRKAMAPSLLPDTLTCWYL